MTEEEKNYHFEEMPLEMLLSTESIPDADDYNNALWIAQEQRFKKLDIAEKTDLEQTDKNLDWLCEKVEELEKQFNKLVDLIESNGILETTRPKLKAYLEGKLE